VHLALQMYMDDKSIEEIMAFFGVSRSTLYTYLRPHLLRPDD
jgi:predicted DNA-binding transcriptional regulator AlpA